MKKRMLSMLLAIVMVVGLVPSMALTANAAYTGSPVLKSAIASQETPDDVTITYEFYSSSWYPTAGTTYKLYADTNKTTEAGSVVLTDGTTPTLEVTLNEAPVRDTRYYLTATAPNSDESNFTNVVVKTYRITNGFAFSYGGYSDIEFVDFFQDQMTYDIVLPPATAEDAAISVAFKTSNGATVTYSGDTALSNGSGSITAAVVSETPVLSYTYTINFTTMNLDGQGTETEPYLITSSAELKQLADCLNNCGAAPMDTDSCGYGNFCGYYFKLTKDIDLNGIEWEPIGHSGSTYFAGHFDGDGHTVSNMTTTGRTASGEDGTDCSRFNAAGLFGWCAFGSVENVTVDNADVTAIGQNEMGYAGGLMAVPFGCSVINCHVKNSTIESGRVPTTNSNFAGGVAGMAATATFEECSSVNNTVRGTMYVGGFIGSQEGESNYTDCYVADTTIESVMVSSSFNCNVGGFASASQDGDYVMENCFVYNCKTQVADGANANQYEEGVLNKYEWASDIARTTNCYYYTTQTYDDGTAATAVAKTTEEFADGTVLAALNGDRTGENVVWMQGEAYPVFAIPTYTVTVATSENGKVEANVSKAAEGDTVTLTVTPASGYVLNTLTVKDADDNVVAVSDNTFTMPASNVTVAATFKAVPAVTNYDLWVGGSQVTSANLSGTGWSFAPETNTLTLNGASITGVTSAEAYKSAAIYSELTELKIAVAGDSTVTGAAASKTHSAGIYACGDLTITGTGALTAVGGAAGNNDPYGTISVGISAASDKTITITGANVTAKGGDAPYRSGISSGILAGALVINSAKVDAIGGTTGTNGSPVSAGIGGTGNMSLTINGNSVVNATGNKRGIHLYSGTFTVNGGEVNVVSTGSDAFSANGTKTINGGTVICQAAQGYKAIGGSFRTTVLGKTIRYIYEDGTSTTDYQRDNAQILASNYIKLTVDNPDPLVYTLWLYTQGGKINHTGVTEVVADTQYKMNYVQYQGAELPPASAMSREGYRFWCWSTSSSTLYPTGDLPTTATGDRILYAWWKELHDISIPANANGTISASVKQYENAVVNDNAVVAAKDDTVTLTITPTAGYNLASISVKDADGTDVALTGEGRTRTFKMPAGSVTVAATFAQAQVTFNANGGTGTMDAVTVSGASYALPTCGFTAPVTTVPGGMAFAGWAYSANGDVITAESITVSGNTELFAIWKYTPVLNQTIEKSGVFDKQHTFDIDLGALLPTDVKITEGISISSSGVAVASTTPQITVGSNSASLRIVTRITSGPANDTVVMKVNTENYGQFTFTVNVTLTGYTIVYELNGGAVASDNPTAYSEETETFTLVNPTRTGYTFKGWSGTGLTGDENLTVTIAKGSTGNRTYTAQWEPISFYIVLRDSTEEDADTIYLKVTYGEDYVFTDRKFSRPGYKLAKWTSVTPAYTWEEGNWTLTKEQIAAIFEHAYLEADGTYTYGYLTAQWERNINGFYIVLRGSAEGTPDKEYVWVKLTDPVQPLDMSEYQDRYTREGYTLSSWSSKGNGTGSVNCDADGKLSPDQIETLLAASYPDAIDNLYYFAFLTAQWSVKPAQAITFDTTNRTATYGDGTLEARTATAEGAITYSSSDESIATVDANGVVTILTAGEVTITASAAETDAYAAGSESYKLTIAPKALTIAVADKSVYVGSQKPDLSAAEAGKDYTVDGLVDGDSVTVALAYVTEPDMKKSGEYEITAIASDSNYVITVVKGKLKVSYMPSDPTYRPTIEDTTGGDTTVSDPNPEKGDKVTITTDPDKGYEVGGITVTDSKGNEVEVIDNGDGTFTYVQPTGKVTITVTYVCSGTHNCPSLAYSDLNTSLWYHKATDYAIENGLMNGVGNGKFKPNGTTSRAMIVTILWRLEGRPVVNYLMQFEDVAAETWYTEAVRWAASEGVIEGYNDTAFGPDDAITREQFATILWRYAKYKGYDVSVGEDTNILSYEDAFSISEYAIPAMQWACGAGLMQGDGVNLTPKADATRVQAAALFQRFCENVAEK